MGLERELQKLEEPSCCVEVVVFSPDGSLLVLTSDGRAVRLWQVSTGKVVQQLKGHTQNVTAMAFSLNKLLLASALDDQTIRLWQVSTG